MSDPMPEGIQSRVMSLMEGYNFLRDEWVTRDSLNQVQPGGVPTVDQRLWAIATASMTVHFGLSDVLAWLGEIDPQDAICDCLPWEEQFHGPNGHTKRQHTHCNPWAGVDYQSHCGGCDSCLAEQWAFYRGL